MQTKLTLRLDAQLIRNAKQDARQSSKSLSQMVAEYFRAIMTPKVVADELTPGVSRLKGRSRRRRSIGMTIGHTQVQNTARYAHLARDTVRASASRVGDSLGEALTSAEP